MTLSLVHSFVSGKSDGSDPTLVQPSNWNAEHTLTQLPGTVLGALEGGSGQTVELPIEVDSTGNTTIVATGYFLGPIGATGQRPGSPAMGQERFNSTLDVKEYYDGTAWQSYASQAYVTSAVSAVSVATAIRQTTNNGPVTSAGLPSFLPASTIGNLNLTTQNLSTTAPLVVSAANGYTAGGRRVDALGYADASSGFPNLVWAVTNNALNFLFVTIDPATNLMTTSVSPLPPIYEFGGVPSIVNGQFTYNIAEQKGYLGNGASAAQAYMVCVGECVASGGDITSVIAYAYNGMYRSGRTNGLFVDSSVSKNHNLGIKPDDIGLNFFNVISEGGYAVGDKVPSTSIGLSGGGIVAPFNSVSVDRNVIVATPYFGFNFEASTKTPSSGFFMTSANWDWEFVVSRGW